MLAWVLKRERVWSLMRESILAKKSASVILRLMVREDLVQFKMTLSPRFKSRVWRTALGMEIWPDLVMVVV